MKSAGSAVLATAKQATSVKPPAQPAAAQRTAKAQVSSVPTKAASNDDLASELTVAAGELAASVGGVALEAAGSVTKLASPDAQKAARKSLAAAGSALGGVAKALQQALREWDSTMEETVNAKVGKGGGSGGSGEPSTGEWWVKEALGRVAEAPKVKEALSSAGQSSKEALAGAKELASAVSSAATSSSSGDDKSKGAVDKAMTSSRRLAKAVNAVAGRITGSDESPPKR